VSKHFGIDANLAIVGVVLVDSEIILAKELEQVGEKWRGEIDLRDMVKIPLEQSTIEIRHARAGDGEYVVWSRRVVQRVEKERNQSLAVKAVFVRAGIEELANELRVAVLPIVSIARTAEPPFLLQEVKEHQTPEQLLDEITDRFQSAVACLVVEIINRDFEKNFWCI